MKTPILLITVASASIALTYALVHQANKPKSTVNPNTPPSDANWYFVDTSVDTISNGVVRHQGSFWLPHNETLKPSMLNNLKEINMKDYNGTNCYINFLYSFQK